MPRIIHARLDPETEKMLREVERSLGWTDDAVIGLLNDLLEFKWLRAEPREAADYRHAAGR